MNSYERLTARLAGEPVDRAPNFNIMMQFAAHYIGQPLRRYYLDHRVLCDANFAVQEAFDLDLWQAISDPYREAADAGLEVDFPDDSLPIAPRPLLAEPADLARLHYPKPEDGRRMSDRLAAVRLFRERSNGEMPVMGWVEGALAEAADVRGMGRLMTDLMTGPSGCTSCWRSASRTRSPSPGPRSRPAPTSSDWGMQSRRRCRPGPTGSSPCLTNSASSRPSTRRARCRGCTSAATPTASSGHAGERRGDHRPGLDGGPATGRRGVRGAGCAVRKP